MDEDRSPGAPKGNKNALKHGLYKAEAIARRRQISGLMRAMKSSVRNHWSIRALARPWAWYEAYRFSASYLSSEVQNGILLRTSVHLLLPCFYLASTIAPYSAEFGIFDEEVRRFSSEVFCPTAKIRQ